MIFQLEMEAEMLEIGLIRPAEEVPGEAPQGLGESIGTSSFQCF